MHHVTHALCALLAAICTMNGYKMCAFVNFVLLVKHFGGMHLPFCRLAPNMRSIHATVFGITPANDCGLIPLNLLRMMLNGATSEETTPTAGGGAAGVVYGIGNREEQCCQSIGARWGESVRLRILKSTSCLS
jgi:hypothetical protein